MALSTNGRISLYCFCLAASVVFISLIGLLSQLLYYVVEDYWLLLAAAYSLGVHGVLYIFYKPRGYAYKVSIYQFSFINCAYVIIPLTYTHLH